MDRRDATLVELPSFAVVTVALVLILPEELDAADLSAGVTDVLRGRHEPRARIAAVIMSTVVQLVSRSHTKLKEALTNLTLLGRPLMTAI